MSRILIAALSTLIVVCSACTNAPKPTSTSAAQPASAAPLVAPTTVNTLPPAAPSLPSASGAPPEATVGPTDAPPAFSFQPPPFPPPS